MEGIVTPDSSHTARSVTIGVAGGTGSGKTTVSNAILEGVGERHIAYLPHDAYYKELDRIPRADHEVLNFDHPDSFDTASMVDHVRQLQQGQPVDIPIYDFSTHSPSDRTQHLDPQP